MHRQLLAAALLLVAPVGCKSVEVAVDYPGMHVAAKFEAHDRTPRLVTEFDDDAETKTVKKADKKAAKTAADPRPSVTITL